MEFSLIEEKYSLINKEDIFNFLTKNEPIYKFLLDNYDRFKSFVDCQISISVSIDKPCNCSDEEEGLLWLFFDSSSLTEQEANDLEDQIFDEIISPAWYDVDGMIGLSFK